MSYSIVYKTNFVKLSDGRYLFLQRQGCNNDEEGRRRNVFNTVEIKTELEIYNIINRFKYQFDNRPYSECHCFELKICGRDATYYDYGDHLLRMFKRAKEYKDFISENYVVYTYAKSITLSRPYEKELSPDEFSEEVKNIKGGYTYTINTEQINPCDEAELIRVLSSGIPVEVYAGKIRRCKK